MLSISSFIPPFWERLPKFFAYPFQLRPLLLILILSSVGVVLSWLPFIPLVLWAVLIKYCYAVLRDTVSGNLRAPNLSYSTLWEDLGQAFKQIVLFLVVGIAVGFIFKDLGRDLGLLCLYLALLLMPAMIIVLAASDSLINALNPVAVVTIVYRIGWGYLFMYVLLALLSAAPALLVENFASLMPPLLRRFLFIFAYQYYTIISYHLMGYVILQYHEEIGYRVDAEDFIDQSPVLWRGSVSSAEKKEDATEAILNQVNILLKDGRAEDAVFVMRDRMQDRAARRVLSERYYNLLKITHRESEMLTHAVVYLDLLVAENDMAAACEVYRESLSLNPQFLPNPETLFKLAGWCMEAGDIKNGWNAWVRFIKANPQHALVPMAYFLLGKNAHEKLLDPARAEQFLKILLRQYPDHDISIHARDYLEKMHRAAPASD